MDDHVTVRLAWVGIDDVPIHFINQVVAQHHEHEFFLTVGQVAPPLLLGSEDERREQAEMLPFVQVTPIARLAFTPSGMRDLMRVLQQNMDSFESQTWEEDES